MYSVNTKLYTLDADLSGCCDLIPPDSLTPIDPNISPLFAIAIGIL